MLTGGAGKTTLLAELAARGSTTVDQSARAIISERLAAGATARPDLPSFARKILRRDIERYLSPQPMAQGIFFDRGVVDALGFLREVSAQPAEALEKAPSTRWYQPCGYVLCEVPRLPVSLRTVRLFPLVTSRRLLWPDYFVGASDGVLRNVSKAR